MKLSVIVPVRCENDASHYILERLDGLCSKFTGNPEIEYIIVDSGSAPQYSLECQEICKLYNASYLYENTRGDIFSISSARDFGAINAVGEAIMFIDVDWRFKENFWDEILELLKLWKITEYKKKFLAIPALYLTPEGTKKYLNNNNDSIFKEYFLSFLLGDKENIEGYAPCSSILLLNRLHYLAIGGHNEEFKGHGYEDFELINRLITEEGNLSKSRNYTLDTKDWNTYKYEGFRSTFSILGRPAMMLNIIVFHLWHPRPKTSSFYNPSLMAENRKRLKDTIVKFQKDGNHPAPMVSKNSLYKNIGYFSAFNSNSFKMLSEIFPILGNPICLDELKIVNDDLKIDNDILNTIIQKNNIKLFLFPNSYGNDKRKALYNWCRENQFPYLVFDRGALPESWFFDPNGCNADSTSYKNYKPFEKLDNTTIDSIKTYIKQCINERNYLEQQGMRIGGVPLLEKLKIHGEKILFIPLQRPSDSVIKEFCGSIESYEKFISIIDILAGELQKFGWRSIAKKHPLETEHPKFTNIEYAPDSTNFIDLIEASNAVALINSGVGIYSMMMQKPCYIFGDAFYSIDGVNVSVTKNEHSSTENIANLARAIAQENFKPNLNKIIAFISFLRNDFYSFGISKSKQYKEADGSLRNPTYGIDFYDIKILNYSKKYDYPEYKRIPTTAPIFERYQLDIQINNSKQSTNKKLSIKDRFKQYLKSHLSYRQWQFLSKCKRFIFSTTR